MSFCNIGKLFKSKKNEKVSADEISLPVDGYESCIQLLLAYTGQKFVELNGANENGEKKADLSRLCVQGPAVLRYVGRCHGLAGSDPFEDLEIDQIVDAFTEFVHQLQSLKQVEDFTEKSRRISKFIDTQSTVYLNKLDAVIAANKGHLALNKVTWADFLVAGIWGDIKDVLEIESENMFPNITAMVKHVKAISYANNDLSKGGCQT